MSDRQLVTDISLPFFTSCCFDYEVSDACASLLYRFVALTIESILN